MRLVFKSKDWYLYGFCLMRNDYRFFKFIRIRDIKILSDVYSREFPATYSAGKLMDIENTIAVTLKSDKKMAFRVYDEFAEAVTEDEQAICMFRLIYPAMTHYTVICFPLPIMWKSLSREVSGNK